MTEICPKCGLPKELCICGTLSKEQQKIKIKAERRRFGKVMTIIEGIDDSSIDVKQLLKKLKSKLACGGTYKDGLLELQGDHRQKAKQLLVKEGFNEEMIEVI